MKKPTILKIGLLSLIFLQSIISYSQNLVAYVEKTNQKEIKSEKFLMGGFPLNQSLFEVYAKDSTVVEKKKVAALTNPVIPYAQLPYAGQVATCPNDGEQLPKLFLCGGNDSRLIDTEITDAQSIIWERFVSGGTCITVSNSDCANKTATATCWTQVGTGKDYLANSAGQFRLKIVDKAGNPFTFYFNVYQNTLIPTATTKSDIIRTSDGSCRKNGEITVKGFGNGYQYSFTTTGSPGAWQDSNIFSTSTAGNYTAFIRIKGVVGSCEFKVINLEIKNVNFAVTTSIASPKCSGATGAVQVITNDIGQQYLYKIFAGTVANNTNNTPLNTVGPTGNAIANFNGLASGNYTVLTYVQGSTCLPERNTITIAASPSPITSGASITRTLETCSSGRITITRSGGTAPYKYYVNVNGAGFVENPTNIIVTTQPGSYVIRVEDANGCVTANNVRVNVPNVTKPIYTINKVDGDCKGNVGKISMSVTNPNGYNRIDYSIDNGNTFSTNTTVFDIPSPGSYRVIVRYRPNNGGNGSYCTEPAVIVTVGPSIALTASAGVGELSGCGPAGKELYGLVRIVNPQGGTPPYEYSFDDKANWVTYNQEYMNYGGPKTVYIRDSAGCEYAMGGITIDKKPDPPTIKVLDPVFNCDGSATTTVTVTNSGSGDPMYSYDYYMDGVLNTSTPSNVFLNVTQGDHTVTVKYNVLKVSTYSNLLQEDFGKGGFTTTPGINPAYCFEDEAFTHLLPGYACNNNEWIDDGEYAVASKIRTVFSTWLTAKDHTPINAAGATDPLGRFLVVNVGGTAGIGGILYSKPIKDVIANQPVIISLWAENLIKTQHNTLHDPKLTIELVNNLNGVGGTETIVASSDPTPGHTNPWQIPKSEKWEYKELSLNPGAYTNLSFVIRSYSNEFNGNDVLIDDIYVRQIPKSCNTVADFPIIVDGSKAFSAGITGYKDIQCNGQQNGEITLSAKNFDPAKGFQYSVDKLNGGAWQTVKPVPAASSGSITLQNLSSQIYNIRIRYDNTAGSCTFPMAQEIKMPTALELSASVTEPKTCDNGATITAVAKNGTPSYLYQLQTEAGVALTPFQSSGVFTGIVDIGKYLVVATDANSCPSLVPALVEVVNPVIPVVAFVPSSLCFDPSTGTNITVNVTGGAPDYTYTVIYNGGSPSAASATFSGPNFTYNATNAGTYKFIIKDRNGCIGESEIQTIYDQLLISQPAVQALDCDPAPGNQAVITGTINGGKAPFVVTLTSGANTGNLTQPVGNGNVFTYSIAIDGTYSFQVKDANDCTTTTSAVINPLVGVIGRVIKATNPSCYNGSDGQVEIAGGGGTGTYTYSFNGSGFTSNTVYSTLNANTTTANTTVYSYQIKDSNGCLSPSYTVALNNPSQVTSSASFPANTSCSGTTTITVTAGGGSGGFKYSFNGNTTYTGTNTLLVTLTSSAQTITYSVQDSNGCTLTKTISVPAYNPPTGLNFSTPATITCLSTTTSVTVSAVGGIAPFTYSLVSGPTAAPSNTTGNFSGLTAGTYVFEVRDANGCTRQASLPISGAAVVSAGQSSTDVKCVGNSDGTAAFTVSGVSSVGNFTYTITPAQPAANISVSGNVVTVVNLAVGGYTFRATDRTTGCSTASVTATVNAATAINFTAQGTKINCNEKKSTISFPTLSGGKPGYTYAYIATGPTAPAAGDYSSSTTVDTALLGLNIDVWVKDINGCTAKRSITIGQETPPQINTPAAQCYAGTPVSVTITGTVTGTATYSIDNVTYGSTATFPLGVGTHTLYIKDGFGCVASTSYTVAPQLTLSAAPQADVACTPNTTIKLTAGGGKAPYTYEVSTTGASGTFSPASDSYLATAAGTYTFRVTDSATPKCSAVSNNVVVAIKATTLTISTSKTDVKCFSDATGTINITPTSGKAPFSYAVTKGGAAVSTTATTTGLTAGTYDVVVTDDLGCTSASTPVVISQPTQVTSSASFPANTSCSGTTTITVTAGGGSGGFKYSFNGNTTYTGTNTLLVTLTSSAQTITYSVQDSNGCTLTKTISVPAYNPPTGLNFSTPATITCLSTTTSVTVSAVGGIAPFTYSLVSGPTAAPSNTTGNFSGLTAGTYVFEVRDANGCTRQASLPISGAAVVSAGQSSTDVKCVGNSDGTAAFTVSGVSSVGNFTYTITPAQPAANISVSGNVVTVVNLAVGGYTFRATDRTTGCSTASVTATVNAATAINFTAQGTKINCNEKKSTISFPTLSGGKPGYTYAYIATGPTAPAAGDYSSSTTVDTALLGLNIDVWVKDINGCTAKRSITIGQETPPQINTPAAQCYAGTPVSVTITGTVTGTATYSIDNVTYGSTATFPLGVGTHTLYIKDGFGCVASTSYTVAPQLTLSAAPQADVACTPNTTIKLTAGGGKAPYTYEVSTTGASGTFSPASDSYLATAAGTYTFRVTDSATPKCSAVSNNVVVAIKATTLTISTSKTDVKCFSDATGTINITPTSGKAPFSYAVTKGGAAVSTTATTTGLTAGTYDVVVTDDLGCTSASTPVVISQPTQVTSSASFPANTSCSGTTTITVTAGGGSGGFKYSFNGNTTYTGTNTLLVTLTSSAQTITYSVQDSNGCTLTKTISVPAYNPPTGLNFSTPATITCLSTTTSVTVSAVGGIAPFTYSLVSGPTAAPSNTTGNFSGLTAGTYVFEVRDANGCTRQASLPISGAAVVSAGQSSTDVKCVGNSDGTAAFTVSGVSSVGNFTYTITPAQPAANISVSGNVVTVVNLAVGGYTFRATDRTTGCSTASVTATVNAATAINFTAQGTKINCNEKKSTISFPTLSGGKPGYTYAYIATGPTAPAAGDYSSSTTVDTALLGLNIDVWVKDINGCTAKRSITIGQETPPQINTPAAQCYAGTPVSVTITGTVTGTATYSIDNVTYGSTATFPLGVGTHTLYIKDGFGCVASTSYTVAPQLTLSAAPQADVACTPNTTIKLTAGGGKAPYTYEVSTTGASGTFSPASDSYLATAAGTYTFRVTDSATPKCSAVSNNVVVAIKATTLTVSTSKTDVKCFSDATGTINITPTSGKAPFSYAVTKGGAAVSTTATTTGLTAGTYDVVVTDDLGCTSASTPVVISQPTLLTASATAPATTTCSTSTLVTVTGGGGTGVGTYTYSINGGAFQGSNTLVIEDNGSDQTIPYRVRDANGCTTPVQNILIKKLNPPTITSIVGTPIYCSPAASTTSTITVTTSNGLLPLTYSISPSAGITSPTGSPNIFEGLLASTTYLLTVTDANGCSDTKSHTVNPVTPIAIAGQIVSNVSCNGGNNGIAKYTVTGFSSTSNYNITVTTVPTALPFTQTLSGDVITLTGLGAGSYKVEVEDRTTGCSKDDTVTITEPPLLTISLASNVNANCSVPTSKVTVTAGGGTPFAGNTYLYQVKQNNVAPVAGDYGSVSSFNLNPTTNLSWDIWVKDAKGCETKLDVSITKDLAPTVAATVQNQCTGSGSLFTIKAVGSGGVGAYIYTINTGAAPTGALLDTFTVPAGTYTITVKDANGCPSNTLVTVNEVLTASAQITKNLTCSVPTAATIEIIAGGGKAGYTYRVSSDGGATYSTTGISGNIFTTNTAGDYQFEVTDSNLPTACVKITNSVKVIDAVIVTASTKFAGPGCNGNTNGYIELKGLTGEAPFKYSIDNGVTFLDTNIFPDLGANTYLWIVRDKKGCAVNGSITLVNPLPINATITSHPIQCQSNVPGSIDVALDPASGGIAPFVYTLYDNTTSQVATSGPISAASYSFPGLSFGDYYVTIVDSKGCEFKAPKTRINTLPRLTATGLSSTGSCITGAYVDINVVVGTGFGPFTYSIYGQPLTAVNTAATTQRFSGLAHGVTYLFQVVDNGGCSSVVEVTTPVLSPIKVTAAVTSNVNCAGSNEGAISFTIEDYDSTTTEVSYQIRDELTNMPITAPNGGSFTGLTGADINGTFSGLKAGSYTLFVKEVNGTECNTATTFIITQPLPVNAIITSETNANSCNSGTQIRVAATGGKAPYQYAFVENGAAHAGAYQGSSLGTLNPFPAPLKLDWDIWVKDDNGCEFKLDHTITVDPSPIIALSVADKCVDEGTFAINVTETTAGFGAYTISVNDDDFVSVSLPYTINGLKSGLNKVIIKDANGCTDTQSITIDKPLEMTPVVTAPNCNDSDGVITLSGTGGTGSYTYSILPAGGTVTANVISGLSPGDYIVTMTDTATPTACSITTNVTIPSAIAVTFNTVTTKVSCFGSSDGTITVNLPASNNNPVYTYAILPAVGTQNDNIFTDLPAGTYRITVTSGRGCSAFDANVVVGSPETLTATATITDYACSGNVPQPARVTVNVDSVAGVPTGTGPYQYNFDGSSTYTDTNVLYVDNVAPQVVHFYVKDANGCLFDDQITVNPYKKITDITFISSAPTCPVPDVNVQLTVVGGYNIIKYEIVSPTPLDNLGVNVFNGLTPNTTYLFRVTDDHGCSFEKSFTTPKLTPIAIVGDLVSDISCNPANGTTNNGVARFTVTGFSSSQNYTVNVTTIPAALSYVLTQPAGTDFINLTNLAAGTYNVEVRDNVTGCSKDASVTITTPAAIAFTASATKVFCSRDESEITVNAPSGGTGAYSYAVVRASDPAPALSAYVANNILKVDTNLADLSWDVYVKDANDCIARVTVPVIYNAAPSITAPAAQCYTGSDLTVDLSMVSGVYAGTAVYTLDGVDLAGSTATLTAPGTYVLGVRDDNGCIATVSYTIEKQMQSVAVLTKDLYCTAPLNATIDVVITDGIGTLSTQMYSGTAPTGTAVGTPYAGASFTASVAAAGDYYFVTTDSNAAICTAVSNPVKVNAPLPVTVTGAPVIAPILCATGTASLQITVDVSAGLEPLTYSVRKTAPTAGTAIVQLSNNVFAGLTAGDYEIIVTDAKGCASAVFNTTITEPVVLTATADPLPANTTCSVSTVITVVGHDGTPLPGGGYYYNFNNLGYTTTNTFTVNDNGAIQTVTYTVKDANGCETGSQSVVVNPLNKPSDLDFTPTAITCKPGEDVSTVLVKATNGVGQLTFEIISTNTATAPANFGPVTTADSSVAASFPNLLPGDYTFRVTDSNGCSYDELMTIDNVVPIAILGELVSDISCNPANGTTNNGVARFTVTGFSATHNYSVAVATTPAALTSTLTHPVGSDVITLSDLSAGTYQVTVTDLTTGCIKDASVTITTPAAIAFTASATKVFCSRDESEITVNAPSGGTGAYSYAVVRASDPAPALSAYVANNILKVDTNLADLSWDVYVKDANDCIARVTVPVIYNAAPSITAPAAQCYTGSDLTVDLSTVSGVYAGTAVYTLDGVDLAGSTATLTAPGTYVLGVRDDNGCIATVSYTIEKQMQSVAVLTKDLYCTAPLNATIDVVITDGIGTLSTQMYSGTAPTGTAVGTPYAGASFTASVAAAGDYYFVTTDSNAAICTAVSNPVKVNAPLPVTVTGAPVIAPILCATGTASLQITVDVSAGLEPLTYSVRKTAPTAGTAIVQLSNNVFAGLTAGDYEIIVTDAKGCASAVFNTTITEPVVLTATADPLPANTTCSVSTVITVVGHDGTPLPGGGYYYNFNNLGYTTTNTFTVNDNGAIQTVTYTVKDANGCETGSQSVVVNPLNKPSDLDFTPTAITCKPGEDVSTVLVKATNGVGQLTFEIISTNTATAPANFGPVTTADSSVAASFPNLLPGDYTFRVTDSNGCSYDELMTIDNVVPIAILGELVSDISCNPANGTTNNGVARFTVTGFSATHNYSVAVATTPAALTSTLTHPVGSDVITLSDLSAGTYQVTVTDLTTGCIKDASVTITTPAAIAFTASATKVFCSRDESEITVNAPSGGTGAYSYAVVRASDPAPALSAYVANNILKVDTNLADLSWDVYVKDANDCIARVTVPVIYNAAPSITAPAAQCYTGSDLTVDLSTVSGVYAGTAVYTLDGVDLAGSTATLTAPGTYVLGVRDDNGCIATVSYTIEKQMQSVAVLTKDLYCTAPLNATIDVVITDGIGTLSTQMYSGTAPTGTAVGTPYAGASFTASVAAAGDYYFVTTDSNAAICTAVSNPVKVNAPLPVTVTGAPVIAPILCATGTASLQITVDVSAGLEPLTYSVRKTAPTAGTAIVQLSNNVFAGLTAGDYEIIVTDAKGCASAVFNTTITEPVVLTATADPLPANTTCSVSTVITVVGHDGTPLPGGGYYYNFNNLGYTTTNTFTVNDNGAIQTVTYTVKDANGCETGSQSVVVNPLNKPSDLDFTPTAITCKPGEDVSTVLVKATNGVGQLTFEIISTNTATAPANFGPVTTADSSVAASFPNLLPGDYTFRVTDSNGCSYDELMTIDNVVNIVANGQLIAGVACKGEANGKVTFTVSGFGALGFTPIFTGVTGVGTITPVGTDKFELTNLVVGTYKIDVIDNTTNCVSTFSVVVPEPATLGLNYATITNANCINGAVITATAFDGTPGYTYAFVKAGDPKVYTTSDTATLDKAFSWVVWAKDANGCEISAPITIITDPMPAIANVVADQCPSSAGTYNITVTASGFTADLEYSLDGNSWQLNNNILTVTTTGVHTVYVRDANLCPVTATVTILEPLKLLYDITTTPICNGNEGVVTLTASGGTVTPSYEYSINGGAYVNSPVFTGLVPGSYTFTVRDTGTNCTKSVSVVIEIPNAAIDFSLTKSDNTCVGSADGTITVTLANPTSTVNNNPVYSYSISPSAGTLVGNVFRNLPNGAYTVTVTSGKGCPVSQSITVNDATPIIVASPSVSEYNCTTGNGTNDATITVSLPTGGTDSYSIYEFIRNGNPIPVQRGSNPVYTETDLLGGSYVINVYDTNGCLGTANATIKPFVGMEFATPSAIKVTRAITCINDEDIQVNVNLVGTTVPMPILSYNVKGVSAGSTYDVTNSDGAFTGLTIGNYTVKVTNPVTGCILSMIHYVNNPNTFDIQSRNVKNVVCYGTATGSADLTLVDNQTDPTDDAGAFDYTITGPVTITGTSTGATLNLSNLVAGLYTVKAKLVASPSCEVETSFTIEQPLSVLRIAEIHTAITCDPGNDGTITASAQGGWLGSYEFELVGPVNVPYSDQFYFENLKAGVYTLNVRDLGGCIETTTVTLKIPDPIVVTAHATATVLTCNGDNTGEIIVDLPTGGAGTNYMYILNNLSSNPVVSSAPQDSPVFYGLIAGRYSVTVVDGLNCTSQPTAEIVISDPTKVVASLVLATRLTCKLDATLTISAVGGTGPYEYSSDANFATVLGSFASSHTFSVGLGDHQYYVRDARGCISYVSNNITVEPLTPLSLVDLDSSNVYCKDDATGTISATAIGGLGNYSFTLLDAQKNLVRGAQAEGYFTLLPAGRYILRVDSGDCQFDSAVFEITQPLVPLTSVAKPIAVTCFGINNGKIEITASGGTGKISYAISPNLNQFFEGNVAGGHVFTNLKAGEYDVITTDENSCFVREMKVTITEPNQIEIKLVPGSVKEEYCAGDKDGAFSIEVTEGTGPYKYSLDKADGPFTQGAVGQTVFNFTGLVGGPHTVYILDNNNCDDNFTQVMALPVTLNPVAEVTYECGPDNLPANKVVINIDSSIKDKSLVQYDLDGLGTLQSSEVYSNLAPGTHYVIAIHDNGCFQKTEDFVIKAVQPLKLALAAGKPEMNVISVAASGGAPAYEYSFNGEPFSSSTNFKIYKSGDYEIIVRDQNGCTATITVPAIYVDVCLDNYFTPNGDGVYDTWGPGCTNIYNNLEFSIFDRYGRVIAKYHYGQKWDGRYNGEELPSGDYWYVLKLNDEKDAREFVGHFTLYR